MDNLTKICNSTRYGTGKTTEELKISFNLLAHTDKIQVVRIQTCIVVLISFFVYVLDHKKKCGN